MNEQKLFCFLGILNSVTLILKKYFISEEEL